MTENFKNNIPTHELTLGNGDIVVFYDYITTGEAREIQKLLIEGGKFNAETGKIEDLSVGSFLSVQDKSASYVIKGVKVGGGEIVAFLQEWLNNLPVGIGNTVYDEVNRITQVSQLSPDKKKV